ncbi:transposase [Staphylococcus simulans]
MVDEFKNVKIVSGKMIFIYCDGDTHEIVVIFTDTRQEALFDYFIGFDRVARVKFNSITMDMYNPYISLLKKLFPKAEIILDRFHLVQALNRELNRCRVKSMNRLRKSNSRIYR